MLCECCTILFRRIEEDTNHDFKWSHQYLFEHLHRGIEESCDICPKMYDRMPDRTTLEGLRAQGQTVMAYGTGSVMDDGSISARIHLCSQPNFRIIAHCNYVLVPKSQQQEHLGFDLARVAHGSGAIHPTHENIPATTRSPEVAALTNYWYQTCRDGHDSCSRPYQHSRHFANLDPNVTCDQSSNSHRASDLSRRWYPPRLLDVTSELVRLVPCHNVPSGSTFAALSHCWGRTPFLGLVAEAIPNYEQDGINPKSLPQNFRDVVDICRWLHIPYLWVDSLCIIQSGPGSREDWGKHVSMMQMVYATSDLCITTTAASGATESCFVHRIGHMIAPVSLLYNGEPHWLLDRDLTRQDFEDSPLALRAWTFQEKLLSRRVLTFGSQQVFWQCLETVDLGISETFPRGINGSQNIYSPFSLPEPLAESQDDTRDLRDEWHNLITSYSQRQLTRPHEDKLVAFAGIAQYMSKLFEESPYIAGFFLGDLPESLLWVSIFSEEPESRPSPSPGFYRAPTWSWAATDQPVAFRHDRTMEESVRFATVKTHSVDVARAGSPFGQLLRAELTLRGPLISLKWERIIPITEEHPYSEILWMYEPEANSGRPQFRETTLYDMSSINYQTKRYFGFDSRNDRSGSQDGVCLFPISELHMDHDIYVGGIIIRPTTRGDHMSHLCNLAEVLETVDPTLPCYMKIGWGLILGAHYVSIIEQLPKEDIILL